MVMMILTVKNQKKLLKKEMGRTKDGMWEVLAVLYCQHKYVASLIK